MIVIGTDTHKRTHALSAVDEGTGKVRGARQIDADEPGHLVAVKWARGLDEERAWAIEDCRQLKPDPRDSVAAQLSVFAIDPDVALGDYLLQAYGSESAAPQGLQVPRQELAFKGDIVYVRTRVDGFKHRRVRLFAEIYNASTQQLVLHIPSLLPSLTRLSARTVELDTPSTSTSTVQLFWILSLGDEPPTFVRIEMYDGTRMLAVADSPVIRNNRAPLPPG